MLLTQLRGHLPALRTALTRFVWALRRLDGQVHSYDRARDLGILPGSHTVDKRQLDKIHNDLIIDLCLLEGCLPLSQLNPALHHFVHYAEYTRTHGCLRNFWMFYFERYAACARFTQLNTNPNPNNHTPRATARRYNKYMKGLVRNASQPEAHLANSANHDIAANYMNLVVAKEAYDVTTDRHHRCVLSLPQDHVLTRNELADLRLLGVQVDAFGVTAYSIAHIMGVHFRAGEWLQRPRCGSVVTCVVNGRSLYGRVQRFLAVEGDACPGYASIRWFSEPEYPSGTPLVVRVDGDGSDVENEVGCIVKITEIDPSKVMVEVTDHDGYYVMRDSGYDTRAIDSMH